MTTSATDSRHPNALAQAAVEAEVLKQLRSVSFGSIEIVIHDSRIVQIERREKQRFDHSSRAS